MEPYICGIFSGISQAIVGHPFNTIKVYYQNNNIKKLKVKNLYKGISYPLLTTGLLCSVNFGVYSHVNNNYSNFISGCVAGLVSGTIQTPIDYYKIKKQLLIKKKSNPFTGFLPCLMREIPAFGIYFSSYNYFLQNDIPIVLAGGMSGLIGWGVTYPLDVIKTRIQSGYSKDIKDAYKVGNLYRGYTICLLRAFPVNAVGFLSYEYFMNIYKIYLI